MTNTETLKLALEALQEAVNKAGWIGMSPEGWDETQREVDEYVTQRLEPAITALRTAIEAAEKQEQVGVVHHKPTSVFGADYEQVAVFTRVLAPGTKLYDSPPAQPAPVQAVTDEDELSNGLALALHDAVLIRMGQDNEATRQAIARIDKLVVKYTSDAIPPAAQRQPQYNKTEMNCFVRNLYDQKMREGGHLHYETMFYVVHRAIEAAYGIKEENT